MWRFQQLFSRTFSPYAAATTFHSSRSYETIPMMIDHTSRGERLLKDRIVCINGFIFDETSFKVVAQILFLEFENPFKSIHLYINSSGGAVSDPRCWLPGKRRALPNARIMIHQPFHQPFGSGFGQAIDMDIQVKKILEIRERLNAIYAKHPGQSIQRIEQCVELHTFISPEEAKEFGLIDKVIQHRPTVVSDDSESSSKDEGSSSTVVGGDSESSSKDKGSSSKDEGSG